MNIVTVSDESREPYVLGRDEEPLLIPIDDDALRG
jgi:hypothetical protein